MRRRAVSYTFYFVLLCSVYLLMVFLFHGQLQIDSVKTGQLRGIARHLHSTLHETNQSSEFDIRYPRGLYHLRGSYPVLDKQCHESPKTKSFVFQEGKSSVFYTYSAYLDRRGNVPTVRIISILLKGKKHSVEVYCRFDNDQQEINGTIYEMCENHNKRFGGYIISCRIPIYMVKPCFVTVRIQDRLEPWTDVIDTPIRIVELSLHKPKFDFGVCVPPLFGDLKAEILIEFIELSKLLGAKHFIFYDFHITNNRSKRLLNFYEKNGIVTLIPWQLPDSIKENLIWYHGQLLAHNDCIYRAISLMQAVSVQDIDEFIIPHDGNLTWQRTLAPLIVKEVVGLSFHSAFFDPHVNQHSGLVTVGSTSRTKRFSSVRTKVIVKPAKIFEIGIHHVSKPSKEWYKIQSVSTEVAYLHHYRKCVSNYGMKCVEFVQDKTLFRYYDQLKPNFDRITRVIDSMS